MSVYIGCSGFFYRDWLGSFYPSNIRREDMLRYYEKFFAVLELNFSFYDFPKKESIKNILKRSKELRFSIKANRTFTHLRNYTSNDVKNFINAITPMLEEDRFIALLFQFPETFHYCDESLRYLEKLAQDFKDLTKVIEVRSKSFKKGEFYSFIFNLGFSLVNVDAPKTGKFLVGPWKSVGSINYVRIHGRNEQSTYDYLYSPDELKKLKMKIKSLEDKETYIFFNNTVQAKAVYNALQMKTLFGFPVEIPDSLQRALREKEWV